MPDQILTSARAIASSLHPAENDLDTSILSSNALLGAIVTARLTNNVPAERTHEAVRSALRGLTALGEARDHLILCHQQLSSLRESFALDEQKVGCDYGKVAGRRPRLIRSAA